MKIELGDIHIYIKRLEANMQPRRERERKGVEALLTEIFGQCVQLCHTPEGAPYIDGFGGAISISHSRDYACVALSESRVVGVDIEQPREQLRRVAPRVLSDKELNAYAVSDKLLLRAWTLKEALYKAAFIPGLDFREQINLPLDLNDRKAVVNGREYKIECIKETDFYTLSVVSSVEN